MSTSFPPEIRVTDVGDGVQYRLPRRGFSCAAAMGVIIAIFGLFLCAAAVGGLLGAYLIGQHGNPGVGVLVGLAICVPGLFAGTFLLLSGLWLTFGHTEVRLAGARIASLLKIGPLTWYVRRRNSADVQRVVLLSDGEQKAPVLAAASVGPRPLELASLYPYDWLWSVGEDIAGRLRTLSESGAKEIELEVEWTDFTGDRPVQPALSRIVVEESAEGTHFLVPAATWRHPGPLILLFIGAALMAVVLLVSLRIPAGQWLVLLLGSLPGCGLLLGAVLLARRRVIFTVRGETLALTRIGLFTHVQSWSREDLAAIRVVRELRKQTTTDQHGHTQTHWVWVVELQIHPATGRPVVFSGNYGMLRRATPQEWEWLATALRAALDVPP